MAGQRGTRDSKRTVAARPAPAAGSRISSLGRALDVELLEALPKHLAVGGGQCLFVKGWCVAPAGSIRRLQLVTGAGRTIAVERLGNSCHLPHPAPYDPRPEGFDCAFLALVPVTPDDGPQLTLHLRVQLSDRTEYDCVLGTIELDPVPFTPQVPADPAKIAVCMATYNPPLDLFAKQIESIRHQSHPRWVCAISDDGSAPETLAGMERILNGDSRFRVHPSSERLGFYRNFERALTLAPADAGFIALADQDDVWYPEKLAALAAGFTDAGTTLVYSDMRLVDPQGNIIANTYWRQRPNACSNLTSLILANTVTGAACMFRANLRDKLLPFPTKTGFCFHDHWIACAALAGGTVRYIDRCLYDYVQHGDNVIGQGSARTMRLLSPGWFRELAEYRKKQVLREEGRRWFLDRRTEFYEHALWRRMLSSVLKLRFADSLTLGERLAVAQLADPAGAATLGWLTGRGLLRRVRPNETVNQEWTILKAHLWAKIIHGASGFRRRRRARQAGVVA